MKLTKALCALLLMVSFASSCIREDLDDCLTNNRLLLSYLGDGTTEIFPDKICHVEMYVFNEDGHCVSQSSLSSQEIDKQEVNLPPLEAGNYRIICLGNPHETGVWGLENRDYERMLFAADDHFAGLDISTNDSLYYASVDYEIRPWSGMEEDDQVKTAHFAASHYDLYVEVIGVPANANRAVGTTAELEMRGLSPRTNFENQACGDPTSYFLETEYSPEQMLLTARANIMRHTNHEDVNLYFRDAPGAEALHIVNLREFLDANPVIDCSKHEVLIPIRIEFKSIGVEVTVPDWYVEEVKPEFGTN